MPSRFNSLIIEYQAFYIAGFVEICERCLRCWDVAKAGCDDNAGALSPPYSLLSCENRESNQALLPLNKNKGSGIDFASLITETGEVNMDRNAIEYEEALWHIAFASKAL